MTFLRGGGGMSPEERPHDVSRGQNQYVTLPLVERQTNLDLVYDKHKLSLYIQVISTPKRMSINELLKNLACVLNHYSLKRFKLHLTQQMLIFIKHKIIETP